MSLIADPELLRWRQWLKRGALGPLLLATTASTLDPAQALAGRYYRQFPDALVGGQKYTGENIIEIVPVATGAAYIRLHLDYYNGHICALSGVAEAKGAALVFDDGGQDGDHCVLRIERSGPSLRLDDTAGRCSDYCGARGTLTNVRLPYSSKRPIRYLARLKGSTQYRHALADWHKDKR